MASKWSVLLAVLLGCSAARDVEGNPPRAVDAGTDANEGFNVGLCSTTITGTVVTPSKKSPDPLYNVTVFIPAEPVEPIVDGVACERCGAIKTKVVAATKTDARGRFELNGIVPGHDVPLVMQIGRWRRQVTIPAVDRCRRSEIPTSLTRMPRNRHEGNIPKIAIGTGTADIMECLMVRMGIDESEFTHPWEPGRIHMFTVNGSVIDSETPGGELLYDRPDHLDQYDIVMLPCEGSPNYKSTESRQNIINYVNKGGRVFTTHYGYSWIEGSPDPAWSKVANWDLDRGSYATVANVDVSFPKGKALADWMMATKSSTKWGVFPLISSRDDLASLNPPTQRWAYTKEGPLQFTFNTPIGAPEDKQCGRVVYSDFHVNDNAMWTSCPDTPLDAQEHVLEYLLFDLANCIQPDTDPPVAPK